jgi:dTDP-4-amino-4,6-dideoxygalactose transaminase
MISFDQQEKHNYQYMVLELQPGCGLTRDDLVSALHAENVLARRYFWPGCHNMQPYRDLYPDAGAGHHRCV